MSATEILDDRDWRALVEKASLRYLSLPLAEVLRRVTQGDTEDLDHVKLMRVLALVPEKDLAR